MQRQSLGSPSSKLVKDESQSPSSSSLGEECQQREEEEQLKKLKPKTHMPQSYIHLIPLLTLLCFLILYLSSHNPSLNDLAEFNSFNAISDPTENISELEAAGGQAPPPPPQNPPLLAPFSPPNKFTTFGFSFFCRWHLSIRV